MLKIRAANPDALILTTYARPAALIIRKAKELGFNKPIILTVTGTADLTQLVENVGGSEALQNFYIQDVLKALPATLLWRGFTRCTASTTPIWQRSPAIPKATCLMA